ncbi:MAG: serine protein kinase RIO [Candidatus Aenigmarchaeota archaeon]|nr:serine protein kinase RIO [Candidatus Aenigmarchaeota archaeon]
MPWYIRKQYKDTERRKIFSGVFDEATLLTLYKMSNKGIFETIHGIIKSGKESSVFLAETKDGKEVAIKVYAIGASNFGKMKPYLIGDPRFEKIKRDKRSITFAWCKKEYKNLQKAKNAGISCPEPIAFANNVLVLEFLGKKMEAYPRLAKTKVKDPEKLYKKIVKDLIAMYKKSKMVHGDLSEYNILIDNNEKPYIIDFSQAVILSHPNADDFLKRDVKNICRYFKKHGINCDSDELYDKIRR